MGPATEKIPAPNHRQSLTTHDKHGASCEVQSNQGAPSGAPERSLRQWGEGRNGAVPLPGPLSAAIHRNTIHRPDPTSTSLTGARPLTRVQAGQRQPLIPRHTQGQGLRPQRPQRRRPRLRGACRVMHCASCQSAAGSGGAAASAGQGQAPPPPHPPVPSRGSCALPGRAIEGTHLHNGRLVTDFCWAGARLRTVAGSRGGRQRGASAAGSMMPRRALEGVHLIGVDSLRARRGT